MTVHKTAYETTACRDFAMKKTIDALLAAFADGWLPAANTRPTGDARNPGNTKVSSRVLLLEGGSAVANDVPAFAHPIALEKDGLQYIVVDVRPYGRFDPHQQEFKVRNSIEYQFAVMRAALDQVWNSQSPTILQNVNQQPMAIFASWISESVGRRFSLDPGEQYKLSILAAIFYNLHFWDSDSTELPEVEKNRAAASIARALRASAEDVFAIIDQVSHLNNVGEFCVQARDVVGSVRLNDFNPGVLFAIVGGSWYGSNSREIAAVALEHPPTWLAVLMAAINERTYKNSGIAKLAERFTGRSGDQLVPALYNVIRLHAQ